MTHEDIKLIDCFEDRYARIWQRNGLPNKSWTCYINAVAADQKTDSPELRRFYTEADAQQAWNERGLGEQSWTLLQQISRELIKAGGSVPSLTETNVLAVLKGRALLIYTPATSGYKRMAARYQRAGGFAYRATTADGFSDWLSSLPFNAKANQ